MAQETQCTQMRLMGKHPDQQKSFINDRCWSSDFFNHISWIYICFRPKSQLAVYTPRRLPISIDNDIVFLDVVSLCLAVRSIIIDSIGLMFCWNPTESQARARDPLRWLLFGLRSSEENTHGYPSLENCAASPLIKHWYTSWGELDVILLRHYQSADVAQFQ